MQGRTVLEHSPNSDEASIFRELAERMLANSSRVIPTPFEDVQDLEALYREQLEMRGGSANSLGEGA